VTAQSSLQLRGALKNSERQAWVKPLTRQVTGLDIMKKMKISFLPVLRFRRAMLCLVVLGALGFFGCGDSDHGRNSDYVRNDDYEPMPEPDYTLRRLMGVRTLRTSFEMPETMRSFRVGMIFFEEGKLIGSQGWLYGDGWHSGDLDGKQEYAKTIEFEYSNWENDGVWRQETFVNPSRAQMFTKINEGFWDKFEGDDFSFSGSQNDFRGELFGDFLVIGAFYGASEPIGMGSLDLLLRNPGSLALLVVEFSEELQPPSRIMQKSPPSDEELQKILESHL
jgi:hypothetical protein